MNRPRFVLTACVAVVAVGLGVWSMFFRASPEECKPVIDLLKFNQEQAAFIGSKTDDQSAAVPTVADDAAYQKWADGLAQRAEKVTDPELGGQAMLLADSAAQFVAKLPRVRAEASARAPGAPAPTVVYEMYALNTRITEQLAQLSKACPT